MLSLAQKQHTCLQKIFLTSKNSCHEYAVNRKQIKSTKAAYSKLRMFRAAKSLRSMQNSNYSGRQGWKKKNINLLHGYMKLNSIIWQFSSRSDDLHVPVTKKYSSLQCWFLHHMSVRHLERDLYERSGFYIRGPGTTVHLTVHLVFSVTPFK